MRNLNPIPVALLVSGCILLIVGMNSEVKMGRVESMGGEIFMVIGLLWIAVTKFRGK